MLSEGNGDGQSVTNHSNSSVLSQVSYSVWQPSWVITSTHLILLTTLTYLSPYQRWKTKNRCCSYLEQLEIHIFTQHNSGFPTTAYRSDLDLVTSVCQINDLHIQTRREHLREVHCSIFGSPNPLGSGESAMMSDTSQKHE